MAIVHPPVIVAKLLVLKEDIRKFSFICTILTKWLSCHTVFNTV